MTVTIGLSSVPMNTLATQHPAGSFGASAPSAPSSEVDKSDRPGGMFLIGSIALHVGLLVAFASVPGPAHASGENQIVEITMLSEPLTEVAKPEPAIAEPKAVLPRGSLDAPLHRAPTAAPVDAPIQESEAPVDAAPEVLAADNPYASADAAVFTSGSSTRTAKVIKHGAKASPGFGVKNGALHADSDLTGELKTWRGKVHSQLAIIAARKYPRRALKLKQQGTAKVRVTIDQTGAVLAASISSGSGVASLDQAALSGIRSIGRVVAPPAGAGTNHLTVPVQFRLR